MPINWPCPFCGTALHSEAQRAGRHVRCPKCHGEVEIPVATTGPATEKAVAAPPPLPPRETSPATPPAAPVTETRTPPRPRTFESLKAASRGPSWTIPEDMPAAATAAPGSAIALRRAARSATLIKWMAAGVVLAACVAAVVVWRAGLLAGPAASKSRPQLRQSQGTPLLVIDWPEADRTELGFIELDGQRFPLQPTGPLEFPVSLGKHDLVLQRAHFEPHATTIDAATPGQRIPVHPHWKPLYIAAPADPPQNSP